MANTFEQWIATLPASIEPEFVMSSPDEQIRLAVGQIELSRGGRSLGKLDGEVVLEWRPRVQIVCVGDSDAQLPDLHDDSPVDLHVPQLGLKAAALITDIQIGSVTRFVLCSWARRTPLCLRPKRSDSIWSTFPHGSETWCVTEVVRVPEPAGTGYVWRPGIWCAPSLEQSIGASNRSS